MKSQEDKKLRINSLTFSLSYSGKGRGKGKVPGSMLGVRDLNFDYGMVFWYSGEKCKKMKPGNQEMGE